MIAVMGKPLQPSQQLQHHGSLIGCTAGRTGLSSAVIRAQRRGPVFKETAS